MEWILVDCLIYQGLPGFQRRRAAMRSDCDERVTIRMKSAHCGGCRIRTTALTGKASSYLPWRVLAGGHNRMQARRAMHGRARLIPRSLSETSSTSARALWRKSSHCWPSRWTPLRSFA